MLNEKIRKISRDSGLYLAGTIISLGITIAGLSYSGYQYSQIDSITQNRPEIINRYHQVKNNLTEATREYKKVVFQFGLTRDSFNDIYRNNSIELSLSTREFINRYRKAESELEKELATIERNGFKEANNEYLRDKNDAKINTGIGLLASMLPLCISAYCGIIYDDRRRTLEHLKKVQKKKQDEIRKAAKEAESEEGKVA